MSRSACHYCGVPTRRNRRGRYPIAPEDRTLDHVIPLSAGGSYRPHNRVTCCRPLQHRQGLRLADVSMRLLHGGSPALPGGDRGTSPRLGRRCHRCRARSGVDRPSGVAAGAQVRRPRADVLGDRHEGPRPSSPTATAIAMGSQLEDEASDPSPLEARAMDSFANDRVVDVTDARLSNEHPTPTPPVSPAALRRAAEVYDAAPRAEDVLPSGFFPAPGWAAAREGMTAAERALAEVDAVRGSLASMHLLHDAGILTPQGLTGFLGAAGGHLRNLRVLLAAMALAAVAVVGLGVPGSTGSASAAVVRVQPAPALVVIDRPLIEVPFTVTTDTPNEGGQYTASVFAGTGTMSMKGWGSSPHPTQTIAASVDAKTTALGWTRWTTRDDVDGATKTSRVHVVRQTHVAAPFISKVRGGWVVYDVQVDHYDVRSGRYLGAALSPVQPQGLTHGRWVNLGRTVTTDMAGKVVGVVDGSKASRVRFVRPLGARDNAGTSPAYKPLDRGTLIP